MLKIDKLSKKAIPILIIMYWGFNRFISILLMLKIGIVSKLVEYHVVGFIAILNLVIIVVFSLLKIKKSMVVYFLIYWFFLCISFFRIENQIYITDIGTKFLLNVFPLVCLHFLDEDPKVFLKYMRVASYFVLIESILKKTIGLNNFDLTQNSYMTYVYSAIVSWSILLYYALTEIKIIDIALVSISAVFFVLYGSRGGLVMIAFSFGILGNTNGSRNLLLIKSNQVFESNIRETLTKKAIEKIIENPFGYGVGYDRVYSSDTGLYVHNVFLEIFVSLGIILGCVIMLLMMKVYFFMLVKCKDTDYKVLFSVYTIPAIVMSVLSGSIYIHYFYHIPIILYIQYRKTIGSKKMYLYD